MIRPLARAAVLAGLAAMLASAGARADCRGLQVAEPWIRSAPPGAMALAAYAELRNTGPAPLTISGLAAADFERAELHRNLIDNGVARMRAVPRLTLAPGEALTLAPGGYHLMLLRPRRALAAGAASRIEFLCDDDRSAVTFVLRSPD